MKKPSPYTLLRAAIKKDKIDTMDIQRFVAITVLTKDMEMNYNTLSKRLLDPSQFTVGDVYRLSILLRMSPSDLYKWIEKQVDPKLVARLKASFLEDSGM
jgi:hypothetical protein